MFDYKSFRLTFPSILQVFFLYFMLGVDLLAETKPDELKFILLGLLGTKIQALKRRTEKYNKNYANKFHFTWTAKPSH